MGWFNKKEEKKMEMPKNSLPELPKLPDLPPLNKNKEMHNQLPKIPNNSFGESFSHSSIKEAVTRESKNNLPEGRKGEKGFGANDFATPKKSPQMMPKPKPLAREFNVPRTEEIEDDETDFDFEPETNFVEDETFESDEKEYSPMKKEPVFVRIDKFEDALKTFDKTKKEIAEIEKVLSDITDVRSDEEKELESWKNSLIKIKEQIDKVDSDIFSKVE